MIRLLCRKCGNIWIQEDKDDIYCNCGSLGSSFPIVSEKEISDYAEKDVQVDNLLGKLEKMNILVKQTNLRKNIYRINGKLTNIKWDRLKNDNNSFWFDASFNDLNKLDYFIFICNTYAMSYVIPCRFLIKHFQNRASIGKNKDSYNFTIFPYKDTIVLNKYNKIDIKEFYNKFDYFL